MVSDLATVDPGMRADKLWAPDSVLNEPSIDTHRLTVTPLGEPPLPDEPPPDEPPGVTYTVCVGTVAGGVTVTVTELLSIGRPSFIVTSTLSCTEPGKVVGKVTW